MAFCKCLQGNSPATVLSVLIMEPLRLHAIYSRTRLLLESYSFSFFSFFFKLLVFVYGRLKIF